MSIQRICALLAGLWGGVLLAIGALAAPAAFAVAPSDVAGRIAGRLFRQEAYAALAVSMLLFIMLRRLARDRAEQARGSVFSGEMLLALAALFLTVVGYFALQPAMEAARMGQGAWSFGALHGLSAAAFGLKGLVVLALAWRLSRPAAG
jgi:hypothetical protein